MSTLANTRLLPGQGGGRGSVIVFKYPTAHEFKGSPVKGTVSGAIVPLLSRELRRSGWAGAETDQREPVIYSDEELAAREEAARKAGFEEARQQASAEKDKTIEAIRANVKSSLEDFARERELYYQKVEAEVVALSLAMARKILHREAQLDPLILTAAVKVALQRISDGTRVRLRVNPDEAPIWKQELSNSAGQGAQIEIIGDAQVALTGCLIESDLGTTNLSVEAQLKEIENGFFDLINTRPPRSNAAA